LFVCTANQFRSALAEVYFKYLLDQDPSNQPVLVESAGTWAWDGAQATSDAQIIAEKIGLSLSEHLSREVSAIILGDADLILVMESGHKEAILQEFPLVSDRVYLLSEVIRGLAFNIPDPYVTGESPYLIGNELIALIKEGYAKILQFANNLTGKSEKDP
jgi:protein-tyrosine-phosphatase